MITPELFKSFCSDDESRVAITTPFTVDGYSYATDGRIIVRVPAVGEFIYKKDDLSQSKPPNVFQVNWWNHDQLNSEMFVDGLVIDVPPVTMHKCRYCAGSGYVELCGCVEGCGRCDGNLCFPSKVEVEDSIQCQECHKGFFHDYISIRVGARLLSNFYLLKIKTLPEPKLWTGGDLNSAMPFVFKGGCGYLMPMRQNV